MGMRLERRNWKKLWLPAIFCFLLLLSEIYLFSGNNFFFRHKHNDPTQLAMLVSAQNQVLHKNEGTLVWRNPEEGSALFREDAIATMADSQAVIAFADKSELIVEPNSLVVLEDPKNNFLAANVVPLVSSQKMSDQLKTVLDAVSAKLTTDALIQLNTAVSGNNGIDPDKAARKWINDNGFDKPIANK